MKHQFLSAKSLTRLWKCILKPLASSQRFFFCVKSAKNFYFICSDNKVSPTNKNQLKMVCTVSCVGTIYSQFVITLLSNCNIANQQSQHSDSNREPTAYKTVALPLSYTGKMGKRGIEPPLFTAREQIYSLL